MRVRHVTGKEEGDCVYERVCVAAQYWLHLNIGSYRPLFSSSALPERSRIDKPFSISIENSSYLRMKYPIDKLLIPGRQLAARLTWWAHC